MGKKLEQSCQEVPGSTQEPCSLARPVPVWHGTPLAVTFHLSTQKHRHRNTIKFPQVNRKDSILQLASHNNSINRFPIEIVNKNFKIFIHTTQQKGRCLSQHYLQVWKVWENLNDHHQEKLNKLQSIYPLKYYAVTQRIKETYKHGTEKIQWFTVVWSMGSEGGQDRIQDLKKLPLFTFFTSLKRKQKMNSKSNTVTEGVSGLKRLLWPRRLLSRNSGDPWRHT